MLRANALTCYTIWAPVSVFEVEWQMFLHLRFGRGLRSSHRPRLPTLARIFRLNRVINPRHSSCHILEAIHFRSYKTCWQWGSRRTGYLGPPTFVISVGAERTHARRVYRFPLLRKGIISPVAVSINAQADCPNLLSYPRSAHRLRLSSGLCTSAI